MFLPNLGEPGAIERTATGVGTSVVLVAAVNPPLPLISPITNIPPGRFTFCVPKRIFGKNRVG